MHRNAARPFFLRENLEDFSVYARHTDALVATIRRLSHFSGSRETDALEFHDLASRFTLDAASEYLFGESIVCTDLPLHAYLIPIPEYNAIPPFIPC